MNQFAPKSGPHIGIISDTPLQRLMLSSALAAYGVDPLVSCEPGQFFEQVPDRLEQVDCWVIELDDDGVDLTDILDFFDAQDVPFLLGLGAAPQKHEIEYISWERRLRLKLQEHVGLLGELESEASILKLDASPSDNRKVLSPAKTHDLPRASGEPAEEVWVLAASLGGPAAVKEFIDELPDDLGVGFLYAQHVDAHFSAVLTDVLARHSCLDLVPMSPGRQIIKNEIQVVPVDTEVSFEARRANFSDSPWPGPYGPSIDQLLANVFRVYGQRCHVIVFSGMGNDSALSVPAMRQAGCEVWTQSPETCANSSMPESVIDLGCSSRIDTPKALAHALIDKYRPARGLAAIR